MTIAADALTADDTLHLTCAWCGRTPDAFDLAPGDVFACAGCLLLSVFTGRFLRRPSPNEARVFAEDALVQSELVRTRLGRAYVRELREDAS